MAPGRKKKKPAVNPARGFATTSTASKSKVIDLDEVEQADSVSTCVPESTDVPGLNQSGTGQETRRDLSDLTPEELEAQLEESDLQLLVEGYSEKSRKESSRHISRLQTERRLLRGQAGKLNTAAWFPPELVQLILDNIEFQESDKSLATPSGSTVSQSNLSTDDLSVKLWTLRRVLNGIGFLEEHSHKAICQLLISSQMMKRANVILGRDNLWGLDAALDWLALSCNPDEIPGYDTQKTEALERIARETIREAVSDISGSSAADINEATLDTKHIDSGVTTPNEQLRHVKKAVTNGKDTDMPHRYVDSDDDKDLDPRDFLERYLALKSRLNKKRPDLTLLDVRRPKKSKSKFEAVSEEPRDPEVTRLVRRLRKLQSDILFNIDEAREEWMNLRANLVQDAAERKKLGLDNERSKMPAVIEKAALDSDTASTTSETDSFLGVGEFFSNLPDRVVDEKTGTANMSTTANGVSITIRDFGKWTGIHPRRIFEEACRARDSSSKIKFTVNSSGFSSRHAITVRWSRPQEVPSGSPLSSVRSKADDRNVMIEMVDISTPDTTQSEAFISTIALFIIFASSPKEEKMYLRLPPTWRDLWAELAAARKMENSSLEREELRSIRKLVEAWKLEQDDKEGPKLATRVIADAGLTILNINFTSNPEVKPANREALCSLWSSKASSVSYIYMLKSRIKLPIWNLKDELLTAIENNQVIIVCGETGCGKSTQVPAFIMENELSCGRDCRIYCTEPRRISAISLARRVSEELGERKNDVGTARSLVGYAIRLESHVTPQTRLVYATTGIVMRMLERSNDLGDITHLVLDEVHERTIDSDFLLIVLRKLMLRRPSLKVILMSATVNAEHFSRYLHGAPVMTVPGRTFPVETRYLEDAIEASNYGQGGRRFGDHIPEDDEDDILENKTKSIATSRLTAYSTNTQKTLADFDEYKIDYDLIVQLLETVANNPAYLDYSKAILIFLPGMAEIRRLNDMLGGHPGFLQGWYVYPLHSTIATEDQEQAFLIPPPGFRKIVLATNIAETGITIPDITCVIDTGKHREMRFDEKRQLSRLIESFISRANAKQRRGRAGRVQNGLCFHLFTKARHDNMMAEQQTPEMLRLSLQELLLRIKICKLGGIEQTLGEALDPPHPKNVRRAIDSLIDVKALTAGEDLTPLGRQLAKLPLDVFLGKLVLMGSIFKCLDAAVTIAALLSSKSPFSAPMGARAQADITRLAFKKGDSDLLTVYNAYCAWRRVCTTASSAEYQFCRKNFLSPQTLSNIEDLKAQLTTSLVDAGFLVLDDAGHAALNRARFYSRERHFVLIPVDSNLNGENELIIDSVIAWSFYPKLLSRDGKGWKNVVNNQTVSLHPTSVNKGSSDPPRFLSFYHIMQSSNKFTNAHETSAAEDFAVALACGDADFKMFSGVVIIDGNRLRFSLADWKVMLALKNLRASLLEITIMSFRSPGKKISVQQQVWFDIWQQVFTLAQKKLARSKH